MSRLSALQAMIALGAEDWLSVKEIVVDQQSFDQICHELSQRCGRGPVFPTYADWMMGEIKLATCDGWLKVKRAPNETS